MHLEAQRVQRPMQVHLERSFAAPRQHCGVGQRSIVNHEMLDSLALARRQFGYCRADLLRLVLMLDPNQMIDGFVGVALVGERCMAAAQEGDRVAYEKLLRDCASLIASLTRRRGVPPDRVDDVVQEVLLTVHRARATYDPRRSFEAWLRIIVRRPAPGAPAWPARSAGFS